MRGCSTLRMMISQCDLHGTSNLVVFLRRLDKPVPLENPPRVSIHDEDFMLAGIKENSVSGLGTYPIEIEKFIP